ncbi:hypothetical protein MACH17_25240 [Phaeobacter inhibens]|nr:hypothetical protein MACH17_25240 [Phaeobacter inhibens]
MKSASKRATATAAQTLATAAYAENPMAGGAAPGLRVRNT